jgi:hypothetical protein
MHSFADGRVEDTGPLTKKRMETIDEEVSDKTVNFNDLSVFASQWLKQGTGSTADLNTDGKVDFQDFQKVGENWSDRH